MSMVRGLDVVVSYEEGELRFFDHDEEPLAAFPVSALLRARCFADSKEGEPLPEPLEGSGGCPMLGFMFKSPNVLIGGEAIQDRRLFVALPSESVPAAKELAAQVREAMRETRRTVMAPLAPPELGPAEAALAEAAGLRPDVWSASRRLAEPILSKREVNAVGAYLGPDEHVLEMAYCKPSVRSSRMLLVVTTLRLLLVEAYFGLSSYELPVSAVVRAAFDPVPKKPRLAVHLGPTGPAGEENVVEFTKGSAEELGRAADAIAEAVRRVAQDGLLVLARPDSADLYLEWEAVRANLDIGLIASDEVAVLKEAVFVAMA